MYAPESVYTRLDRGDTVAGDTKLTLQGEIERIGQSRNHVIYAVRFQ